MPSPRMSTSSDRNSTADVTDHMMRAFITCFLGLVGMCLGSASAQEVAGSRVTVAQAADIPWGCTYTYRATGLMWGCAGYTPWTYIAPEARVNAGSIEVTSQVQVFAAADFVSEPFRRPVVMPITVATTDAKVAPSSQVVNTLPVWEWSIAVVRRQPVHVEPKSLQRHF